jgi:hypothetical protein
MPNRKKRALRPAYCSPSCRRIDSPPQCSAPCGAFRSHARIVRAAHPSLGLNASYKRPVHSVRAYSVSFRPTLWVQPKRFSSTASPASARPLRIHQNRSPELSGLRLVIYHVTYRYSASCQYLYGCETIGFGRQSLIFVYRPTARTRAWQLIAIF